MAEISTAKNSLPKSPTELEKDGPSFSSLFSLVSACATGDIAPLIGPRIIFRGIANLFFGLQCIAGLAFEVDWFEPLTSLGDHFENFVKGGVLSK